MGKHYTGEVGTIIIVGCGCIITGATNTKLLVKKPDGTEVELTCTINSPTSLEYIIQADDLSLPGRYYLQAYITLANWTGRGETASFIVNENFK